MIKTVTITGADNKTNPKDLIDLSLKFPFVEWGILVSNSKIGTNRYPSIEWINKLCFFKQFQNKNMNLSLHICGEVCQRILKGEIDVNLKYPKLISLDSFDRMQLNFNYKNSKIDLLLMMNSLSDLKQEIIFQYNKSNKEIIDILVNCKGNSKWNFLYDSSGGRGVVQKEWEKPLNAYTGYAGGLNPENLKEELEKIKLLVPNDNKIWIDAESGIRTDNEFDLDKVEKFLSIAKEFIKY